MDKAAEERVRVLRCPCKTMGYETVDSHLLVDENGRVNISADDIDLIADLVVERLKGCCNGSNRGR